jgi:hypothetical protein
MMWLTPLAIQQLVIRNRQVVIIFEQLHSLVGHRLRACPSLGCIQIILGCRDVNIGHDVPSRAGLQYQLEECWPGIFAKTAVHTLSIFDQLIPFGQHIGRFVVVDETKSTRSDELEFASRRVLPISVYYICHLSGNW